MKKTVITVVGKDSVGIIAEVCNTLSNHGVNILDISQTIVSGYFTMVLVADISSEECRFECLSDELTALGDEMGVQIRVQRSEIFDSMYRI